MNKDNFKGIGRIHVIKPDGLQSKDNIWFQLGDALIEGLKRQQKFIPIEFIYDDIGSELFDRMTESKEYYLSHKESEILRRHGRQIVDATKECDVYELGSGSAKKTSILVRHYKDANFNFAYYPIDINQSIMEKVQEN